MKFLMLIIAMASLNAQAQNNDFFEESGSMLKDPKKERGGYIETYIIRGDIGQNSTYYIENEGVFIPTERFDKFKSMRVTGPDFFSELDGRPIFKDYKNRRTTQFFKLTKNGFIKIGEYAGKNKNGNSLVNIDGTIYKVRSYYRSLKASPSEAIAI
jgi:hypothetical protein